MKILIIAPPRVGGRIFSRWLSLELNHLWVHEPFHNHYNIKLDYDKVFENRNIVVKINFDEWSKIYEQNIFFSKFDFIIGMTRQNIVESSISFVKAVEDDNFTKNYIIDDDWINKNKNLIDNQNLIYEKLFNQIKKIENSLQITYEGIFENKSDLELIKNQFGIQNFTYDHVINQSNRYRNNKPKII